MYCKQCHYPLVGLDRSQCPECGRAFNPDDPRSFDPNPWSPKFGIYQWIRFAATVVCSMASAILVWINGDVLLLWYYGQNVGARLLWSMRRHIGPYDTEFVAAGCFSLAALVVALVAMRRSKLPVHVLLTKIARCFAIAAATWWIGWYLAMHHGYLLFPLYPMTAYEP